MSSLTIHIPALLLYLIVAAYLLYLIKQQKSLQQPLLLLLSAGAIIMHAISLYTSMISLSGIDLGIHHMASLVVLCVNTLVVMSSIRKPLHNLFIILFPAAIVTLSLSILMNHSKPHYIEISPGVITHILLSILAYSLLTIAVLQGLLWSWQNYQLKHHRLGGSGRLLPPLQTMELLMFELVWAGVIALSAAIIFGFIYLNNIFAQHLVHKTVLSLFAWMIFVGLLVGRYRAGWRGNTAVRWLFSGFILLMLAYFGSKLVLEVILK